MSGKMMTILEADRDIWADSVTHVNVTHGEICI